MNAAAEPIDGGKATLPELRRAGIDAVTKALGPIGMARFLQQFDPGRDDYTTGRDALLGSPTVDELMDDIELQRKDPSCQVTGAVSRCSSLGVPGLYRTLTLIGTAGTGQSAQPASSHDYCGGRVLTRCASGAKVLVVRMAARGCNHGLHGPSYLTLTRTGTSGTAQFAQPAPSLARILPAMSTTRTAIEDAERAGFDLSLMDASLAYSYEKRAIQHQEALNLALELERVGRQLRDEPQSPSAAAV